MTRAASAFALPRSPTWPMVSDDPSHPTSGTSEQRSAQAAIAARRPWIAALAALLVAGAGAACILVLAGPAHAQQVSVDLGDGGSLTLRAVQIFALITLLSLAPGLAVMVTCFPFMVTVLSILRQAVGVQQAPPNMMIVSLALFLTWFVMEPVFTQSWNEGVKPMVDGALTPEEAFAPAMEPFRSFMERRADPETIATLAAAAPPGSSLAQSGGPDGGDEAAGATDRIQLQLLIPSFLLSEIQRGFEVGFLIFLPFLVIDLVIAAILMSMGMMMVPPAVVSLPFKLAFFVLADGWTLLAGAMVRGYSP